MKKIIIFNSGSFIYGAEKGLLNLIDAIANEYKIYVVVPQQGPLVKILRERNVQVTVFPLDVLTLSFSPFYFLSFILSFVFSVVYFVFYVLHNDIDIIYTNTALIFSPAFVANITHRKHVWHLREFFPFVLVNRFIAKIAQWLSTAVVCQSQNIKNNFFPFQTIEKIHVIYEGLRLHTYRDADIAQLKSEFSVLDNRPIISFVSRIHPSKGQYEFIQMLPKLFQKVKTDAVVLIVGDVASFNVRNYLYKKRIKDFIRKNSLEKKVLLLGFRYDSEKIIFASDICVFPLKRNEPFGIALVEALAVCPEVYAHLNPGFQEIDTVFGNKCKPFSCEALEKAIASRPFLSSNDKKICLPEIFSFHTYQIQVLSFLRTIL